MVVPTVDRSSSEHAASFSPIVVTSAPDIELITTAPRRLSLMPDVSPSSHPPDDEATFDSAFGAKLVLDSSLRSPSQPRINTATYRFPLAQASPGALASLRSIIFASYFNILLIFIPISWALNWAATEHHNLIIISSLFAIVPLSQLLAYAVDDLSLRVGSVLTGFLHATVGNAVELIVAILALKKCGLSTVQSSLVGSILSNLLLVLGMCLFAGGLKFYNMPFNTYIPAVHSRLLTPSIAGILFPASFRFLVPTRSDPNLGLGILKFSRIASIVFIFLYASMADLLRIRYAPKKGKDFERSLEEYRNREEEFRKQEEERGEEEIPVLNVLVALTLVVVVIVLVAITGKWFIDASLVASGTITKGLIDIILLPIAGNVADHVTALSKSYEDKISQSILSAIDSSVQIILFVFPFTITLAWMLDKPLTLLFDPFESIALAFALIAVFTIFQTRQAHWFDGIILISLYLIIAVLVSFYPGTSPSFVDFLPKCH